MLKPGGETGTFDEERFWEDVRAGFTVNGLRRKYRIGQARTVRLLKSRGLFNPDAKHVSQIPRPAPADFSVYAPVEASHLLGARYGAGSATIARWRKETGIAAPRYQATPPKRPPAKPGSQYIYIGAPKPPNIPGPDSSMAGMAAQHLRRWFPRVFRARTIDPKASDDLWIVGSLRMTTDELIRKAEAKGWEMAI